VPLESSDPESSKELGGERAFSFNQATDDSKALKLTEYREGLVEAIGKYEVCARVCVCVYVFAFAFVVLYFIVFQIRVCVRLRVRERVYVS
jgi:hypothetical protein